MPLPGPVMPQLRAASLLPRSLAGRMFSVFSLILLVFLGAALGGFYRYQFLQHIEETQDSAAALVELAAQAVEDSVVIGDYDTVKRTLEKALMQSPFKSAAFIDVAGGVISVHPPPVEAGYAPGWLRKQIGEKLYDVNRVAAVGGKDYGVIRISFDEQKIAAQLWALLVQSAWLAAVAFAVSLVLMRTLLKRWLKNLGHLRSYEHNVAAGEVDAEATLFADAPLEIMEAIKAVNRTAASMRSQYGQRIDELMHSLVQHKSAMDQAAIVCEVDVAGRITAVNDHFVRNCGLSRAYLLGRELSAVSRPSTPGELSWSPEPRVWNGEVTVDGPAGSRQWQRTIVPILDAGGVLTKFICIDIDITERHDATTRLAWLAENDPLTSLPNRRHLASCIERAIGLAQRDDSRACVMFIDLDGFKHVNDIMGHSVGDELLVQTSQRLKRCVRGGDVVARLGGDEFAVVLLQVREPVDAAAVGAKLVDALARPFHLQGQQIFVSASIGIACYPEDGASADALLKSADIAMYSAKNSGRNNYQFYAPEMNENAAQRLLTENQLRVALERGQFLLHYQPKAKLGGNAVCGFEALLRWQHPQRGLVPPLEFVGILEDTGLIIPVGEWVIAEVCRQLRHWELAGLQPLPVSINLSARQLQQRDLAATVERIVRSAGVDPHLLEFELTESMLMSDPETAVATLSALKAQGMRLSVDDFGTGYSSLAYLKRFPLDALKIDRTFVRDLAEDPDDAAITMAVIRLAHSLNLQVVAEGVETVEQVRILEGYACDQIQGYYLGRPAPPEACAALLAQARQTVDAPPVA